MAEAKSIFDALKNGSSDCVYLGLKSYVLNPAENGRFRKRTYDNVLDIL